MNPFEYTLCTEGQFISLIFSRMKVILLTDIAKVGLKYDVKEVSSGYAHNFLYPRNLAEIASISKVKNVELMRKKEKEEQELQEELLGKSMDSLKDVKILMVRKANEQGHLFEGIHKEEIRDALLKDTNISIHADMIELSHPIKAVGEHEITVMANNNKGTFKLEITGEK